MKVERGARRVIEAHADHGEWQAAPVSGEIVVVVGVEPRDADDRGAGAERACRGRAG